MDTWLDFFLLVAILALFGWGFERIWSVVDEVLEERKR